MDGSGRSDPACNLPAPRRRPPGGRRAGRRAARQPAGRLAAPQSAQGRAPGDRPARRQSPHLPARPRRGRGAPRPARPVLVQGPDGLPDRRRATNGGGGLMTTRTHDLAVRRQIVVAAPIERAFRVFTEDFGSFKPPEHNLLGVEIAETVFEPRQGGHLFDRGVDGSECRWARVLVYEPPSRVVISWDISPEWRIETDHERTSEVEVRFVAEAPDRTRVELEHRHLERHGRGWEGMREAVGSPGGWPLYLERFAERLTR